jgi:hypothetical protein
MVVWRVVGALMLLLGHMWWVFGILGGAEMPFLVLFVSRWVMGLGPSFDMMFGVGILLWRKSFWSYFALQGIGMLWWLTKCLLITARCIGTWILSDWCTVRRWYVSSFFNALYFVRMGQGDEHKFCWIPSERRSFEVNFLRSYPS